mmetsp:Transcript_49765/g.164816  ORF Transcript_49765/g.164816 Transcript_49765/m.164816 type:complete len:371 (-) Transcript_49765:308-1420(-)
MRLRQVDRASDRGGRLLPHILDGSHGRQLPPRVLPQQLSARLQTPECPLPLKWPRRAVPIGRLIVIGQVETDLLGRAGERLLEILHRLDADAGLLDAEDSRVWPPPRPATVRAERGDALPHEVPEHVRHVEGNGHDVLHEVTLQLEHAVHQEVLRRLRLDGHIRVIEHGDQQVGHQEESEEQVRPEDQRRDEGAARRPCDVCWLVKAENSPERSHEGATGGKVEVERSKQVDTLLCVRQLEVFHQDAHGDGDEEGEDHHDLDPVPQIVYHSRDDLDQHTLLRVVGEPFEHPEGEEDHHDGGSRAVQLQRDRPAALVLGVEASGEHLGLCVPGPAGPQWRFNVQVQANLDSLHLADPVQQVDGSVGAVAME